jgi:hypothetical protein
VKQVAATGKTNCNALKFVKHGTHFGVCIHTVARKGSNLKACGHGEDQHDSPLFLLYGSRVSKAGVGKRV